MTIDILFDDDSILAVNKPAGLSTIPNDKTPREESIVGMLEERFEINLFVVHRLDKGTSGVLLFAKTKEAHRDLNMQFEARKVSKKYLAIVEGVPKFDEKEINIPISRSKIGSKKVALASKGFEAITKIKVIERFKEYSLLEIIPVTGKRHQIRLHLKAAGHPLAVDPLYGRAEAIKIKGKVILDRMPLHAAEIGFVHPETKETVLIKAELAEDMRAFRDSML